MARSTFLRRGLVEEDLAIVDRAQRGVAAGAANISVHSFEFEGRSRIVIEDRGLPLVRVVATDTAQRLSVLLELSGVRIGVTTFALPRRGLEIHVEHS